MRDVKYYQTKGNYKLLILPLFVLRIKFLWP